jgi:hypothetical protein
MANEMMDAIRTKYESDTAQTIGKKMQCCSRPVLLRQCVLEQQLTMVEASELKHWQAGEDS